MAATRQQGTYLGTTLGGFTAFCLGFYTGGALGVVIALAGAGLLAYSAVGFRKAKSAA
jgi:hypothetical protein